MSIESDARLHGEVTQALLRGSRKQMEALERRIKFLDTLRRHPLMILAIAAPTLLLACFLSPLAGLLCLPVSWYETAKYVYRGDLFLVEQCHRLRTGATMLAKQGR
jgi:hypothetical protein